MTRRKNIPAAAAAAAVPFYFFPPFVLTKDMDVNLVNSAGMPLVWFSVVFMQKGDSGVMLRYLQQKGADITMKNSAGQTVLFLLVSSRGKEAIPTLQ